MDTYTDRRTDQRQPMRAALLRLRIAEANAVMLLPTASANKLAEAIQRVVDHTRLPMTACPHPDGIEHIRARRGARYALDRREHHRGLSLAWSS